jgi:DNA-binding IclR family transcriptional regulator
MGFVASRAISVAAKLGIADLVAEAPRTVDELARATKAHASSLRRFLLMLASIGIFAEDSFGRRPPMRPSSMLQRLRLLRWFSLRSLLHMIFLGLSEWWMWAEAKAGCCTESFRLIRSCAEC